MNNLSMHFFPSIYDLYLLIPGQGRGRC
uniref:Uncharacterized protein n=1 Tax=Anguilla anguilla TaxID=7936 RepID=A0A0E9RF69_ANGAN